MARIETNTNLVGKTIVLLNGTKTKIEDAIASGYKVKGQTKRIATRCVVKEGAHFREIERMNLSQLEDTGEGYVKLKEAKAAGKKATAKKDTAKEKAPKTSGKKTGGKVSKEKEPKVRRKSSEEQSEDYQNLAHAIIKGGKAKPAVEIESIDETLTDTVAKRLVALIENSEIAKVCADNKTPIANAVSVAYGAEYAEENNTMQITLSLQYAKPVKDTAVAPELDEAVAKRAAKLASKKIGKVLAKAIKAAFDLEDANDLLPGTVLTSDGAEFVFVGESAKHAGKALMYSADTDGFKSFGADKLSDFEIVADESEEEEEEEVEEEEEEEVEEEEEEEEDSSEEEDGEEEEGDAQEYEFVAVEAEQLELVSKKVTAKYHAALAERFGVDEEALAPGLMLTDGETTFAYLGCDNKGGLLVIDVDAEDEDDNVLVYSKADIKTLTDFSPVIDSGLTSDEEEDGEEEDDNNVDFEDEEGEEEEDEEEDFEFDDAPTEDLEDLTEDELRDRAVEAGLTTPRKADKMTAAQLRKLLK